MVRRTNADLNGEIDNANITSTALTRYVSHPTYMHRRTKKQRVSWAPETEELCCSCTRSSTCQTNLCDCVRAKRKCRRCRCHRDCVNQPGMVGRVGETALCCETNECAEDASTACTNGDPAQDAPLTQPPPQAPSASASTAGGGIKRRKKRGRGKRNRRRRNGSRSRNRKHRTNGRRK